MPGGLMQIIAHGAQDVYLTGNADITFFKVVYRRHTNFAVEAIEQTFNGTADFGRRVQVTVSRNADLITRTYLRATLPPLTTHAWVSEVGHFLIDNVQVEIGGQCIDRHFGEWLSIWNSLTMKEEHTEGYNDMIGNVTALTGNLGNATTGTTEYTVNVPLRFWFNRNAGLALPLIALQYHEVKFTLEFATLASLVRGTAGDPTPAVSLGDASLWVDYVYLARDERRRFAQSAHEYLIEQLQFQGTEGITGNNTRVRLNLNHPVKELIWVIQETAATADGLNKALNNFTDSDDPATGVNPLLQATIQLNGHERFSERDGAYFNLVQPYQHHTRTPPPGLNLYSFCEKPEEFQPTGSANFSRIDNATLVLSALRQGTGGDRVIRVYAVNYNVLRVMSGMGGLAFAN